MADLLPYLTLAVSLATLAALLFLLLRPAPPPPADALKPEHLRPLETAFRDESARSRKEAADSDRDSRIELQTSFSTLTDSVSKQLSLFQQEAASHRQELAAAISSLRTELTQRLDAFGDQQVARFSSADQKDAAHAAALREELSKTIGSLAETLVRRVSELSADTRKSAEELKTSVATQLTDIRADNEKRLEQMRLTVDEKLQSTLDQRLGEKFGEVRKTLDDLNTQLGELKQVGGNVKDLTRVLANVKTVGVWGEIRLEALLDELMPGHFEKNVATANRTERVEFAIRFPGDGDEGNHIWLPIDSKFPIMKYQQLLAAQESADLPALAEAGKALETQIWNDARNIRDKYIRVPATTNFGILFLPIEGLYAEVAKRPGLIEELQRECRVMIAGPTTLCAMLNSLQMGFRTLSIQKRGAEIGKLLGAVRTQFEKYAELISKVRDNLVTATGNIDKVADRTRIINDKLEKVERLPDLDTTKLLGDPLPPVTE